jgi:hypothetical protein
MRIVLGILGVALVATLADYTWYTLHVRHSMVTGIIHGAVLLTAVGAVLGLHAGRVLKGLPITGGVNMPSFVRYETQI